MHRTSEHELRQLGGHVRLRDLAKVLEKHRDDVLVRQRMSGDDGRIVDQRAAKNALDRAHQPAVDAVGVLGDRFATEVRSVVLGIEEERRRDRRLAEFERHQRDRAAGRDANGGVGRAEVDSGLNDGARTGTRSRQPESPPELPPESPPEPPPESPPPSPPPPPPALKSNWLMTNALPEIMIVAERASPSLGCTR